MSNRINFLPPWVETNMQPAFYDKESGSCLQQTARMYAKVNQLVRIANDQWETIQDYINKFIELKDYVEDYFENLDVQEEINNKLDVMAQDGTLGELLNNYMKPYIDEKIEETTHNIDSLYDILSETMDLSPKGAYSTTSALVSADPATGIYVVTGNGHIYQWTHGGDTPTDLGLYQTPVNNNITEILNSKDWHKVRLSKGEYIIYPTMERKIINSNGTTSDSTTRLSTVNKYRLSYEDQVNVKFGFNAVVCAYDEEDNFLGYYPENEIHGANYRQVIFAKEVYEHYPTTNSFKIMIRKGFGDQETLLTDSTNLQLILSEEHQIKLYDDSLDKEYIVIDNYSNGVFASDGTYISSNARLASNEYVDLSYFTTIRAEEGYEFALCCWDKETRAWIGYIKDSSGASQLTGYYLTSIDVQTLPTDRLYRIVIRNSDTVTELNPLIDYVDTKLYFKAPQEILNYITVNDSGVEITNGSNSSNEIWSEYNGRLAFGLNTSTAKVPTINNQQLVNYGTLITMKNGGNNRWGYHAIECYDNTNYNRITLLTDKHIEYGRRVAEFYYYTGASHANASYGNFKVGSDVRNHSFSFNRDEMIADGAINAHSVIQLARINPSTDLITTYDNYAQADAAYDPEDAGTSANNAKCCRYIQLKNAENGAMFYDTNRNKLVCKVDGVWSDVQVTPVPDGTYPF